MLLEHFRFFLYFLDLLDFLYFQGSGGATSPVKILGMVCQHWA